MKQKRRTGWAEKVQRIDNKVLYIIMLTVVSLPLLKPLGFPITVAPNTRAAFNLIDGLQPGSTVFHSISFVPSGDAELWPQMEALAKHFMSKGLKIVYFPTSVGGERYGQLVYDKVAPEFQYAYGKDFAILPFKAGVNQP